MSVELRGGGSALLELLGRGCACGLGFLGLTEGGCRLLSEVTAVVDAEVPSSVELRRGGLIAPELLGRLIGRASLLGCLGLTMGGCLLPSESAAEVDADGPASIELLGGAFPRPELLVPVTCCVCDLACGLGFTAGGCLLLSEPAPEVDVDGPASTELRGGALLLAELLVPVICCVCGLA